MKSVIRRGSVPALTKKVLTSGLFFSTILSACQSHSDPEGPLGRVTEPASISPRLRDTSHFGQSRFSVALEVDSAPRPGGIFTIHASITAEIDTPDANVAITAPELVLTNNGVDIFHSRSGVLPAPLRHQHATFRQGETLSLTVPVKANVAGYYPVFLFAGRAEGSPIDYRAGTSDAAVATIWLYVSDDGGRVTQEFDPSVLPQAAYKRPGPITLRPQLDSTQGSGRSLSLSYGGCARGQITYWDPSHSGGFGAYLPLPGVKIFGLYTDQYEGLQFPGGDWADDNGYYEICGSDNDTFEGDLYLQNQKVDLNTTAASVYFTFYGGDSTEDIQVIGNDKAHLLYNITYAATEAQNVFGVWVGPVGVVRWTTCSGNQTGKYENGTIYVCYNQVWGDFGEVVQAHEYGHAIHARALGGAFSGCSQRLGLEEPTSLYCALGEGVATFIGAVARRNFETAGAAHAGYVAGYAAPFGQDGSIIELAVASMFWDAWEGSSGSFLADVYRSCTVQGGTPNGVDHFVYFLEGSIYSTIINDLRYFPTRSVRPTSMTVSALPPAGWMPGFRGVWEGDLAQPVP